MVNPKNTDQTKCNPYSKILMPLEVNGSNFLTWKSDLMRYAKVMGLAHTLPIEDGTSQQPTPHQNAIMTAILNTHMAEALNDLFIDIDESKEIWEKLEAKYARTIVAQKEVIRRV